MIIIPWLVSSFIIFVELYVGFFLTFFKIKRNKLIGVRIKYSFSSDKAWYFANRLVGIVFLIIGICQTIVIYPIYTCLLNSYFVIVTLSVCFSQSIILILTITTLLIFFKVKGKIENI